MAKREPEDQLTKQSFKKNEDYKPQEVTVQPNNRQAL